LGGCFGSLGVDKFRASVKTLLLDLQMKKKKRTKKKEKILQGRDALSIHLYTYAFLKFSILKPTHIVLFKDKLLMGEELSKIVFQQLNHNIVLSIPNTPLLNTLPPV